MSKLVVRYGVNAKHIILLAMLYTAASTAADTVAYNFSNFFGFVESGATIIFPITYVLGDTISEVYGWKTAMKVVWFGLAAEALFALLISFNLHLTPINTHAFHAYEVVLGKTSLFVLSGIISNAVSGLLNIYLISKWKVWCRGKVFWLRSILSTCISEFVLIVLTITIAFLPYYGLNFTSKIFINAYVLEVIYAIIFVIPAQILVWFLRNSENIDNYDYDISYNPFNFRG